MDNVVTGVLQYAIENGRVRSDSCLPNIPRQMCVVRATDGSRIEVTKGITCGLSEGLIMVKVSPYFMELILHRVHVIGLATQTALLVHLMSLSVKNG